jgi:hypothetical protein
MMFRLVSVTCFEIKGAVAGLHGHSQLKIEKEVAEEHSLTMSSATDAGYQRKHCDFLKREMILK